MYSLSSLCPHNSILSGGYTYTTTLTATGNRVSVSQATSSFVHVEFSFLCHSIPHHNSPEIVLPLLVLIRIYDDNDVLLLESKISVFGTIFR